jgi:hypothetical protein
MSKLNKLFWMFLLTFLAVWLSSCWTDSTNTKSAVLATKTDIVNCYFYDSLSYKYISWSCWTKWEAKKCSWNTKCTMSVSWTSWSFYSVYSNMGYPYNTNYTIGWYTRTIYFYKTYYWKCWEAHWGTFSSKEGMTNKMKCSVWSPTLVSTVWNSFVWNCNWLMWIAAYSTSCKANYISPPVTPLPTIWTWISTWSTVSNLVTETVTCNFDLDTTGNCKTFYGDKIYSCSWVNRCNVTLNLPKLTRLNWSGSCQEWLITTMDNQNESINFKCTTWSTSNTSQTWALNNDLASEKVTCMFTWSTKQEKCSTSYYNSNTQQSKEFECAWLWSCEVNISWPKWTKLKWYSTAIEWINTNSTIDWQNETTSFMSFIPYNNTIFGECWESRYNVYTSLETLKNIGTTTLCNVWTPHSFVVDYNWYLSWKCWEEWSSNSPKYYNVRCFAYKSNQTWATDIISQTWALNNDLPSEKVTCIFTWSLNQQKCSTSYYDSTKKQSVIFSCLWIWSCEVNVSWPKWTKLSWDSTAIEKINSNTTIDWINETVSFIYYPGYNNTIYGECWIVRYWVEESLNLLKTSDSKKLCNIWIPHSFYENNVNWKITWQCWEEWNSNSPKYYNVWCYAYKK